MKKRITFIILSIINILISIFTIINFNNVTQKIYESEKEQLEALYGGLSSFSSLETVSTSVKMMLTCTLLFSIIIIIHILRKRENYHKGQLITFSTIMILLSSGISNIITLSSIILLILSFNITSSKKVNKPLPIIKDVERSKSNTIKAFTFIIIDLLCMFVLPIFIPDNFREIKNSILYLNIAIDLILFSLSFILYGKEIISSIKLFIKNSASYIKDCLKTYGKFICLYFAVSIIVLLITKDESANQNALSSMPILFVGIASVFGAPVYEEAIYRLSIRKIIKSNTLFRIISSLTFAAIHVTSEASLFLSIIHLLPYAVLGYMLAYIYTKTNNIASSMALHMLHNSIAFCILLLG